MKFNGKSMLVTSGLMILLFIVIFVEIALFTSGPQRKYEKDIEHVKAKIVDNTFNIENIKRHTFYYDTYVGETHVSYVWFNEKGEDIAFRRKDTRNDEKVKEVVQDEYHANAISIELGYGYKRPVYVVECEVGTILLDYDSLKEVYFYKK